jgi:catechol 2,3-dioxygenase-like lactoylglutathione lyase family enzyme
MTATKTSKSESRSANGKGIPTMSGMEHIGLCVPNLDEAIAYFCDIIGCEFLYRHGPYVDHSDGPANFYTKFVGLHPRTKTDIAMLRCGNGSNLELFEMEAPGQNRKVPPFSDHGGAHFCFYVDDMGAAVEYLLSKGVKVMGGASKITAGPEAGAESASTHFETPWGQMLEVISYPHGREYEKQTNARLWVPNQPDTWY